MRKIIHNLRQQPEEVRTHILHVLTAGASVLLVSLWVYSLGTNFSSEEKMAETKGGIEPLSALKANIIGGYKSLSSEEPVEEEFSSGLYVDDSMIE